MIRLLSHSPADLLLVALTPGSGFGTRLLTCWDHVIELSVAIIKIAEDLISGHTGLSWRRVTHRFFSPRDKGSKETVMLGNSICKRPPPLHGNSRAHENADTRQGISAVGENTVHSSHRT